MSELIAGIDGSPPARPRLQLQSLFQKYCTVYKYRVFLMALCMLFAFQVSNFPLRRFRTFLFDAICSKADLFGHRHCDHGRPRWVAGQAEKESMFSPRWLKMFGSQQSKHLTTLESRNVFCILKLASACFEGHWPSRSPLCCCEVLWGSLIGLIQDVANESSFVPRLTVAWKICWFWCPESLGYVKVSLPFRSFVLIDANNNVSLMCFQ